MSLAVLANNLASKGRNGDTMLVHMSPNEVAGLHALAVMHGEKLTINPQTGLPEAFSLKSLMPMIVGAALNYFVPGLGSAIGGALGVSGAAGTAIAVGAGYGLANRSLSAGIMAGLGAYGGASLGNALTSTGSLAMNQGAIDATLAANPGLTAGEIGREMGQAGFVAPQIAASANPATAGVFDKLGAGVSALGTAPGRADFLKEIGGTKGLMQAGYAAALPIMADKSVQTATKFPVNPTTPYQKKPPIVWNWRTGRWEEQLPAAAPAAAPTPTPEQTGQTQPFIEQPPGMKSGGIVALADGGGTNPFTNEQIYKTYQDLLGQGMSREQILEAAQRNPNIGLNAGQIDAALAQYQKPAFTDQQFLDAGRTALQGGLDPQTALQRAAEFGATQDQLNRLTGALGTSGITGLTTPTSTLGATPPATGGLNTLASQTAAATSTTAPAATTGAGIAGLAAANPFQAGMRQDLYGEFLKAQQSGNWSDFSRKAQEMNMGPEEIAALFPNISAANVTQFAKERGFGLGTSQVPFVGRGIEQFLGGDATGRNIADQLAAMSGITLTPEQKADMYSKMAIGSPLDMRPFLAESLEAAIAKKDFSRLNDILKKYDISQSELKSIFQSVNNPAIEEFVGRGLKFDALPDWLRTQRWVEDPNAATQIARAWKQEHGRDISPDELKLLSFQLGGQYPKSLDQVLEMVKPVDLSQTQAYKDAEARGERYMPSTMDLLNAGLSDVVGIASLWDRYDWNKILASKDPRAAVIATNRLIAQSINDGVLEERPDVFTKIGDINGVPVIIHNLDKGRKQLLFNGASITQPEKLYEQFYKLGFGTDEMNKLADIADKSGIKYKPGEMYAGSDAGVDLRDIAAGGYGTATNPYDYEFLQAQEQAFPEWAKGQQWRYDTIHKGNYYADQLGLSLNRNLTNARGYVPQLDSEIRPVLDKEGKPLNYAVRSGGGLRYFKTAQEAAQEGQVINLTGREPLATYTGDAYRPGERLVQPKDLPEGYLYKESKQAAAPKPTAPTPRVTTPTTPTTTPTATTPTTGGGLAGLAGAGAGGAGAGAGGAGAGAGGAGAGAGAGAGTTMGGIRDVYTQGGGSTGLQNIGEVRPGQNIYTQNNVVGALQEYMKAYPGATYNQLAAKAKELGIPDPQLRAALNEYRFGSMTGTSKAAYDYLMGRGAYPTTAVLPEGKPIARDYAEAMGLSKPFTAGGERTTLGGATTPTGSTTTPTGSTTTTSGTTIPASVRASLGTAFTQGDYGSVNNMLQEYKLTVDDILRLFPNLTRAGVMEAVASGKLKPYGLTLTQSGGSGSGMGVGSGLAGLSSATSSIGAGQTSEVVTEGSGKQTGVIGGDETTGGGSITGGLIDKIIGTQDPSIVPVEDRTIPTKPMAMGGMSSRYNLGSYSDGGRLLRGPGDGVSDSIPATIGDRQPARLADGEFVIPARIVSEIGNGSTEAGARKLYAMMDRVQRARSKTVGKGKVARDTKADKYLPA